MPDHSWMRDVLIDIAMYAEKHEMLEVYARVALAIEAVLLLGPTAFEQPSEENDVVIQLSRKRSILAESAGDILVHRNQSG